MQDQLGQPPTPWILTDGIWKPLSDVIKHLRWSIDIQRGSFRKDPQIVDTIHMVGMVMGIEYGIQSGQMTTQCLEPELWSGIDYH
jgi:hypothetical protein